MGLFGTSKKEQQSLNHLEGAKEQINKVRDRYYGNEAEGIQADPNLQPGGLSFTFDPYNWDPNTLHALQPGQMETSVKEDFLDPGEASAAGLQGMSSFDPRFDEGGSHWATASSAFDGRDPSGFEGLGSEFEGLGSAFEGVGYNEDALSRMQGGGDYFANLAQGGSDPIAEAQFARGVAEAEASRKANTDAALAAEEARGMGSGSGRLLAELSNQQASVGDQYLAGLDAASMAASRRDFAARTGADIGQMIGSEQRALDTARAQGLDSSAQARARGIDDMGVARAQGLDTYSNQNAMGQDAFTGDRATGMDDFVQTRQQGMDDWAQHQYDAYYGTSERNADRAETAGQRNTDHMRFVDATNNDMMNNAAHYNQIGKQETAFDQQMRLGQAGADVRLGAAGGYNAVAQQPSFAERWAGNVFTAGSNIAKAKAGQPPS